MSFLVCAVSISPVDRKDPRKTRLWVNQAVICWILIEGGPQVISLLCQIQAPAGSRSKPQQEYQLSEDSWFSYTPHTGGPQPQVAWFSISTQIFPQFLLLSCHFNGTVVFLTCTRPRFSLDIKTTSTKGLILHVPGGGRKQSLARFVHR